MELKNIRRILDSNGVIVSILAVVLLVVGIVMIIRGTQKPTGRPYAKAYFVDEETLTPQEWHVDDIPPVTDSHGHALVAAFYRSCDRCATRTLVYLQKYDAESKAAIDKAMQSHVHVRETVNGARKGLLVRRPAPNSPWVQIDSPEGVKITETDNCPPGYSYLCYPDD